LIHIKTSELQTKIAHIIKTSSLNEDMDELKRLTRLCRRKNHTRRKKTDPVTRGDSHSGFFKLFVIYHTK